MTFRRQHPFRFAQNPVWIMLKFQQMDNDQGIDALAAKRQVVVPGPHMRRHGAVTLHQPLANGTGHGQRGVIPVTAKLHQKTGATVVQQPTHRLALRLGHHAPGGGAEPGL